MEVVLAPAKTIPFSELTRNSTWGKLFSIPGTASTKAADQKGQGSPCRAERSRFNLQIEAGAVCRSGVQQDIFFANQEELFLKLILLHTYTRASMASHQYQK